MPRTFLAGSIDCRLIVDGGGSLPAEVVLATALADELAAADVVATFRLRPQGD